MKRKLFKFMVLPMVLIFLLSACTPVDNDDNNEAENDQAIIASLEEKIQTLEAKNKELEDALADLEASANNDDDDDDNDIDDEDDSEILLITALEVMEDIKEKDFSSLAEYVGAKGLLFSPYGFVDIENAIVFSKEEVKNLANNQEEYEWGVYDGIGDPIVLTFDEYYDEFIYDKDFMNPDIIGNNVRVGQGNTIENIHEAFEDARYLEFHFQGFDDEFEGLDWVSLRLVFVQDGDSWNLVAIVHDEWTI